MVSRRVTRFLVGVTLLAMLILVVPPWLYAPLSVVVSAFAYKISETLVPEEVGEA